MSFIGRIKDREGIRSRGSRVDSSKTQTDLPLDHQLTFKRDREQWSFKNGHIFVQVDGVEEDVENLVKYENKDIRLWCGVSEGISEYKDMVLKKKCVGRKDKFIARAECIQHKVMNNMKKMYVEKVEGVSLHFGDGAAVINNLNVRSFLAMYHMRPTQKAQKFLFGLKAKLALILVNRNGSDDFDRVHRVVQHLYEEVIDALKISPIETYCLPSADRSKSAQA